MRGGGVINQDAVTVEFHTQLINYLSNRERKRSIRNQPSIHATLMISVLNLTVGNQISASDVDRRRISSQIVQNWTVR